MKHGHFKKKAGSLLLAAAMVVTSFPAFATEVHATGTDAGGSGPSWFATKEQLRGFDTDDSNGKNSQKVYFGNNNQEWWIVGSQEADSVTLFAVSPLPSTDIFDRTKFRGNGADIPYSDSWGCSYTGTTPSDVSLNHYGASVLRTTKLKQLEDSCFSAAEKELMRETTIYTNDFKNSTNDTRTDCVYSTTDILYLAYAEGDGEYITVGENAAGNLNNGLRIDREYWGDKGFWLRAPYYKDGSTVWSEYTNPNADPPEPLSFRNMQVIYDLWVVPAFKLNLSDVLFASAVKAASSDSAESGTIADETMTLRLNDSGKKIGTVSYNAETNKIVAQKDANATGIVTLVVQGKSGTDDWYYSVPAGTDTVVTKEQIETACSISGIDLAECKIWLETTEDKVTYAKMVSTTVPAGGKVETESGKEMTLPNGGSVDQDGNIEAEKIVIGDIVVTAPSGGKVTADKSGNITIPAGGKVETGDGKELTLPNGGSVDQDEKVETDKIVNGDTTVTAPSGEKVTADKAGNITLPAGGTIQTEDGKEQTLPNGGSVDQDGNVEAEKIVSGDTTVTAPEGGKVTADKAGNITVPAGGTVQTEDGKAMTLPNGGSVGEEGNIEAEKIVNGDTTVTAPSGGKVTADKAGNITLPAGGKVETGDGKELTLPNGGSVDQDEKVEADKIVNGDTTVTAPSGGKVTADKTGNITIPAGGKVGTGDGKELTLPNGGSVDKDEKVETDKIVNGDTTITAPEGGKITADKAGNISLPAGGTVQTGDGKEQTLEYGGRVDKDGNVQASDENGNIIIPAGGTVQTEDGKELTLPNGGKIDKVGNVEAEKIVSGDITVTAPSGGKVTADKAGNVTVPAGGKVGTGAGKELTLPNGGSVDKDEKVEADKIVSGDTTVTAPSGGKVTADKAGNVTVPAGGKVGTGAGKELTLPNGGSVDKDEKVEADKIVSGDTTVTAPSGGKVTLDEAGNITVPAGGTVQTGDGKVTTLPNGGTVDNNGTVSQTPAQTTKPPTTPTTKPTAKPTTKPTTKPNGTVSPEEVRRNSEKLDSSVYARWKGNAFRLSWKAVQGAEGYDIFAAQCEKKLGKKSFTKTVKGNKKSVSLAKIAGKKVSGKKNYKFIIKAWKYIGGKKVYIGSSKVYYVAGKKHKKYTNAKKLIPAKKKYTLKKGKKVRLKVRVVKQSKKKKLLPKSYGPAIRYFSSNKKVATVTSKGKVKAKKKGTCYIYTTALSGLRVKIKIKVK